MGIKSRSVDADRLNSRPSTFEWMDPPALVQRCRSTFHKCPRHFGSLPGIGMPATIVGQKDLWE